MMLMMTLLILNRFTFPCAIVIKIRKIASNTKNNKKNMTPNTDDPNADAPDAADNDAAHPY